MFWIRQSVPYLEKQWSKVQDYHTVCGLHSLQSKCSDRGWVNIITTFCPHWWPDRRLKTTMAGYDFPAVVQALHMVVILFPDFILFSSSAEISVQSTITFHGRSWFCCRSQWQSRLCDRTSDATAQLSSPAAQLRCQGRFFGPWATLSQPWAS